MNFLKSHEFKVILACVLLGIMVILLCETAKAQKQGVNKKPLANDDYIELGEHGVVMMDLFENDEDADNDEIRLTCFYFLGKRYAVPNGGSKLIRIWDTGALSIMSIGYLQFWPVAEFKSQQNLEIKYVISDNHRGTDTARVLIRYLDSVWTYPDTNGYCIPEVREGLVVYLPLVKRMEVGVIRYYYDAGYKYLVPISKQTYYHWYRKKIKKGQPYYTD